MSSVLQIVSTEKYQQRETSTRKRGTRHILYSRKSKLSGRNGDQPVVVAQMPLNGNAHKVVFRGMCSHDTETGSKGKGGRVCGFVRGMHL